MRIGKLLMFAMLTAGLAGCPDKNEAKPDPATASKVAPSAAPSGSAAKPAATTGGGSGW